MTQLDAAPVKLGRKRDLTRDPEILEATLDVLAETGYDGMTIDMVAARAKAGKATVYRRWSSKSDLVIDAVACMKAPHLTEDELPDTGSLRGDLVALIKPHAIEDGQRKLAVMAGLVSMLSSHPELADAATAAIIEPRARINRILFERAAARGEISPDADLALIAQVSSAMATHRTLIQRKQVDRAYLISLIDGLILPALGVRPVPAAD